MIEEILDVNVPVVKVKFNTGSGDLIFSLDQWKGMGGYKGFLKEYACPISFIDSVTNSSMLIAEFENLGEWEP